MKAKSAIKYLLLTHLLSFLLIFTAPGSSQTRSVSISGPNTPTHQNASDDALRLESNLVTIPATVMDRNGRYITSLHKADFQILEDGIEQEVAFFAPVEQPFTIFFLLDTSSSMSHRLADLSRAADAFFWQLRPDDQLVAASFSDKVRIMCHPTSIKELRESKRLRLIPGGSTLLYDAVDDALKRMRKISGRKAIVLFSDGLGSGVFASPKRNICDAEEADVLIYTVQFNTLSAEPPPNTNKKAYFREIEDANNYMRDLAHKSGGRHYQVESISDLGKTFGLVADELRTQYSLAYYPKKQLEAGQKRQIRVKVRLPDLVVRSRNSYIIGQSHKNQP
jgi:Ca-activated chloride channel family protein